MLPKIGQRFLNSLPLFIGTTLIVWSLSFPVGIQAAVHQHSDYGPTVAWHPKIPGRLAVNGSMLDVAGNGHVNTANQGDVSSGGIRQLTGLHPASG
ncbi:MAG: hypothetical protein ACREA0_04545 [bacterium]